MLLGVVLDSPVRAASAAATLREVSASQGVSEVRMFQSRHRSEYHVRDEDRKWA